MKAATVPSRGPLSLGLSFLAALACAVSGFAPVSATAQSPVSVDTELLLLVDVAGGGLKKGDFDNLMEGYASALTSSEVVDSIASGKVGKIAVSLSFFGSRPGESVGIPWMAIGSASEAQLFASRLRALSEPKNGSFNYEDALSQSLLSFGTETGGGSDNGFQSALQIVEVVGATQPKGDVDGVTALALSQGVDMIGATVLVGKQASRLESFYENNVIGGGVGGFRATVATSPIDGALTEVLKGRLTHSVGTVSAIPEPSSAVLLISSVGVLLLCSRRREA